jgi:hypothetical protein
MDLLEAKERRRVMRAAVGTLPESMRRTTSLFYLDGLSYGQTADVLGVPVSTVKMRLFRARKTIREGDDPSLRDYHTPIKEIAMDIKPVGEGLHVHEQGYGFLRHSGTDGPAPSDVYVSASQIHRFELRATDRIAGHARPRRVTSPMRPS